MRGLLPLQPTHNIMASTARCLRLAVVFLSSAAVWAAATAASRRIRAGVPMSVRHEQWMAQHGRVYRDEAEKARRLEIFSGNAEYVESLNRSGNRTYTLGLNRFADLTTEEFALAHLGGYRRAPSPTNQTGFKYAGVVKDDVPTSLDWRNYGVVTPVKDQGVCGSCWAFSATGAIEGLAAITSGQLISLSEQEVLDCTGGHDGCHDGNMIDAFQFVLNNGGITSEDAYPYHAAMGQCDSGVQSAGHIGGYQHVPNNNEAALLVAVANQPVSVAVAGLGQDFHLYSGGVFTGSCDTNLNHAVLAIGYGTADDGTQFWLLKNQWGTSWGEGGYMRLQRNVGTPEGLCGVAMDPSFPTP